jgi:hypothetical protein
MSRTETATTFGRSVFLFQRRRLVIVERMVCILSRTPPAVAMSNPSVRILGINSLLFAEMHMAAKKSCSLKADAQCKAYFLAARGRTNCS